MASSMPWLMGGATSALGEDAAKLPRDVTDAQSAGGRIKVGKRLHVYGQIDVAFFYCDKSHNKAALTPADSWQVTVDCDGFIR